MSDRTKWNARYQGSAPEFTPHPLVHAALAVELPPGDVLELACGPSGTAIALATAGRHVLAVDVSDVALGQLADEAARRGLSGRIDPLAADLTTWLPPARSFALVLATRFWDPAVFARAAAAVAPGGVLAWETFTLAEQRHRPSFSAAFCLADGEPASLLPPGFDLLDVRDLDTTRRLLARCR